MPKLPSNTLPHVAAYLGFMALAAGVFIIARGFPAAHMGPAGPGFFPQVIAVVLFVLCGAGIIELWRVPQAAVRIPARVGVAMVLSLGYIFGMYYIGYYLSTFLFAFLAMWLVRDGASFLRVFADAVALVSISYLFFELMIDAYLPTGVLFEFLQE